MNTSKHRFAHTALTVSDLDTTVAFYLSLGFQKQWMHEMASPEVAKLFGLTRARARVAYLTMGSNALEIYQFFEPVGRDMGRVMRPVDRGISHISVLVEDLDAVYAMLTENGYEANSSPVAISPTARAVVFRDPDGIAVELFEAKA